MGRAQTELGSATWPEVADRPAVLLVPLGSCEQHGPHLPLDTDTRVAEAVARAVAARVPAVLVAPPVTYGSSGEHAGFPGTLSIGQAVTEELVVELGHSAHSWDGVVFVNGHGGNRGPVERAVARLRSHGRRVTAWWPEVPGGDAHAGRTETSLMLAIDPDSVRLDRAEAGVTDPLDVLWPRLRDGGVGAVSANGVLGDPAGASADEGRRLLEHLVEACAHAVLTVQAR